MVYSEVGMNAAGVISVLFAAGHDGVCGVADVGGCTAILRAPESVHHIGSIMTGFGGPCGETGAEFLGFEVNYDVWGMIVYACNVIIEDVSQ